MSQKDESLKLIGQSGNKDGVAEVEAIAKLLVEDVDEGSWLYALTLEITLLQEEFEVATA
jgi:hypothetical protein